MRHGRCEARRTVRSTFTHGRVSVRRSHCAKVTGDSDSEDSVTGAAHRAHWMTGPRMTGRLVLFFVSPFHFVSFRFVLSFLLHVLCHDRCGARFTLILACRSLKKDQKKTDTCVLQSNAAAEDIEVDAYVTFTSPGVEDQRSAFSVKVPQVGPTNTLTYEWRADTQRLIEQLAARVPHLPGAFFVVEPCRAVWPLTRPLDQALWTYRIPTRCGPSTVDVSRLPRLC